MDAMANISFKDEILRNRRHIYEMSKANMTLRQFVIHAKALMKREDRFLIDNYVDTALLTYLAGYYHPQKKTAFEDAFREIYRDMIDRQDIK